MSLAARRPRLVGQDRLASHAAVRYFSAYNYQNLHTHGSPSLPRIALIHATPVAIDPIAEAFKLGCETVNLLDDSLSQDRARTADLTQEMSRRILALGT